MKYNKGVVFSRLILLLTLCCFVYGDLAITTPIEGTRWRTGELATVYWYEVVNTRPSKGPINIGLTSGPTHNLVLVAPIAVEVDPSIGSYTWMVPYDLIPGVHYSVRIGSAPNWSYSHYFTIENGSQPPNQNYPEVVLPPPSQVSVQNHPEPAAYSPPVYEAPALPLPPPPPVQPNEEFADQEDQPEHYIDSDDPPITLDMEEAYGEDYVTLLNG